VHHAILELHRRRLHRNPGEDLRPQLVARVAKAIEASGLEREAYAVLVRSRDDNANAVVDEALAELAQQAAKREALLRAFEASGRSEQEFADMYGMKHGDVTRTLQRVRSDRKKAEAAAEAGGVAEAAEAAEVAEVAQVAEVDAAAPAPAAGAGSAAASSTDEATPAPTPSAD
jgi:ProP effector